MTTVIKGRASAIDSRLRSLADLIAICERRHHAGTTEPLLVVRARKDLDREIGFDHKGVDVREDLVDLAARLDEITPRIDAVSWVDIVRLIRLAGIELDALPLLGPVAAKHLRDWLGLQLTEACYFLGLVRMVAVDLEALIAKAEGLGVKLGQKGNYAPPPPIVTVTIERDTLARELGVDLAAPDVDRRLMAAIFDAHPDRNASPDATERTAKLNRLRELVRSRS